MKKLISGFIFVIWTVSGLAQGGGTIIFANSGLDNGASFRSRVYGPDPGNPFLSKTGNTASDSPAGIQSYNGPGLLGSNYLAQLFTAPGLNQSVASLVAQLPVDNFRNAGLLYPVPVFASNLEPDSTAGATAQVRVWDNSSGLYPRWEQAEAAWTSGLIAAGESLAFNITDGIGGLVFVPTPLANLRSFNIYLIPEPTSVSITALALLVLSASRLRRGP
jgi:hypothetical protein